MYTSIAWIALCGSFATETSGPKWQNDYRAARKEGAAVGKPLAVFLGPGKEGYDKLVREGRLGKETMELLAAKYVCVMIDTTTARGKELANDFEMPDGLGLVVSDRSGETQAFRHEGSLSESDLRVQLQKYGEVAQRVRTTDSISTTRVSFSAPTQGSTSANGYPTTYTPLTPTSYPSYQPIYQPALRSSGCST